MRLSGKRGRGTRPTLRHDVVGTLGWVVHASAHGGSGT